MTTTTRSLAKAAGLLAIALTASTALAGCSSGSSTPSDTGTTTIRVASNTNVAVLPAWVADQEGYFKEHNLDVQFTQVADVGTLPPALGSSFDMILTPSPSLISAASQGIGMVAAAGATLDTKDNPTAGVVVANDSGITSYGQLGGKTVGALAVGGAGDIAMRAAMQQAGVNLDTVKVIGVPGATQADQLFAGRIAAVQTGEPFRTNMLKTGNATDIGDPYLALAPNLTEFTAIGWGALGSWAEQNPQAITNFRAALDEAIAKIKSDPDVARTALKNYAKLPDDTVAATILPEFTSEVHPDDYAIWLQAMKDVSGFNGDVNLDDLFLARDKK